jgi:hypothetical protein
MKHGIPLLLEMLTYRRPAFSGTDRAFIRRFLRPLGAEPDPFGNFVLRIGDAPDILWSAHTDTVHRAAGRQRLRISGGTVRSRGGDCLGADNTAGVWMLVEMARAGVPGLYVWHRAEEIGCQGSRYIATHTPHLLNGIRYAIAFDRRGTDSIVTHQIGWRTASDAFAWQVAGLLGLPGMYPDPNGVYTDTESYADIVPECTNISIGYAGAHTAFESLDLDYVRALRDAVVGAEWHTLTAVREPGTMEAPPGPWNDGARLDDGPGRWQAVGAEDCALCGQDADTTYIFAGTDVCRACFDYLCRT